MNIDTSKWTTQQALANDLGIAVQNVNNWVKRGKIATLTIPEWKLVLVDKRAVITDLRKKKE